MTPSPLPSSPTSDTKALIRRLLRENLGSYVKSYIGAVFCMILVAGTTAASAWIVKDIVNQSFIEKRLDRVALIALTVIGLYLVKGFASYGQTVLLERIGNNMVARHQKRLFAHLLAQDIHFFETWSLGELVTRFSQNVQAMRSVLDLLVTGIGRDGLTVIGLVTVMLMMDPLLTLVTFLIGPIVISVLSGLLKKIKNVARAEFTSNTQITETLQETLLGIRSVKALGCESFMKEEMDSAIDDLEKRANRIARLRGFSSPLMESLGGIAVAGIIFYGGYQVITQNKDPGSFIAFIAALLMAYEPIKHLAKAQLRLQASLVGVRLMYELLDSLPFRDTIPLPSLSPLQEEEKGGYSLQKGHVVFKNVSYRYPGGDSLPVLRGLSFEACPGTLTAIVGPSGAGKSTIFSLLERFYEGFEGSILIDGCDLTQFERSQLRRSLSLVSQETFLFSGTVYDNLTRGCREASRAEVEEAARMAHAHAFICALPQGYATQLGRDGALLSGGQRQRLAIARAFLRNTPLLLLDEATSALDSESEAHIQGALQELMKDRTTIAIAHRLSTVRYAERIYVLDAGRVAEEGTHTELLEKAGLYARLHALQFHT